MSKQINNKKENYNDCYTLLGVVYLSDIAHYNEYDWACNGGYYNCPNCNEQQYTSSAESGEQVECDCGKKYVFE